MIRSMTGYGHFEETVNGRKISTEIKSVNQRFTDFNIKGSAPVRLSGRAFKKGGFEGYQARKGRYFGLGRRL